MPGRPPTPYRFPFLIALLFVVSSDSHAVEFFDLSELTPGAQIGSVAALSPNGEFVAGRTLTPAGVFGEPFIWSRDGGFVLVEDGTEAPERAMLFGVSNDGGVAVGHTSNRRAFRWTPESGALLLGGLNPEKDESGTALGVSADGKIIVGEARARQLVGNLRRFEAFVFREETGLQALQTLEESSFHSSASSISPNGEFIAGVSGGDAFIWTEATGLEFLGESPDGGGSTSDSVSSIGIVVGELFRVGVGRRATEAFLWRTSTGIEGLGDLAGGAKPGAFRNLRSFATGVSRDGRVVVGQGSRQLSRSPVPGQERPFIWTGATGIQRLEYVLRDAGVAFGWDLVSVAGVSEDGRTLVGDGVNPDGEGAGWMAILPLPIEADVVRGGRRNWILGNRDRLVRVVLRASDFFDPSDVDTETLRFGRGSARALERPTPRVRRGARGESPRLVVYFSTIEATIGLGAHYACVRGSTLDGTPFEGCDRVLP